MTVTAINGSPKGEVSNSMEIISMLKAGTAGPGSPDWQAVSSIREWRKPGDGVAALLEADTIVVVFPLYVDGLPASLMALLERFGAALDEEASHALSGLKDRSLTGGNTAAGLVRKRRLYGAANCGFYEGVQTAIALEILSNFAAAHGLEWSGGIGIGTGEMIGHMKNVPPRAGIRKPVVEAVNALAAAIAADRFMSGGVADGLKPVAEQNRAGMLFTQHAFPRWLFKLAGESGWRKWLKKNGVKRREIFARPLDC